MDTLDMICSLEDGDEMEVPVNHLVDEPIIGPMLLEDVSHGDMEESGAYFNTRPKFRVGEEHLKVDDPFTSFSTSPPFTTTTYFTTADSAVAPSAAAPSVTTIHDIDVGPSRSNFSEEVEGYDYSTKDRVESEVELVADDDNEEYDSDVHKKFRELRSKKRKFQRRKKMTEYQLTMQKYHFELDEDDCCDAEHDEVASGRKRC
ncbi:hypothetical protein CQW23_03358 [Capsicum baccatum]|uniref:Uncharacterized protein n=1 Tax=Capsicum baccatum TaxID=33114 RepID=A0A2G2XBJ2_CAPBA|nr:hypothetical protein CQW23_03358 [Capsicum baccatum]